LENIQIIKKVGGKLTDSYLDEGELSPPSPSSSLLQANPQSRADRWFCSLRHSGFILEKTIAVNSPKRIENAKIMIANTCSFPFSPSLQLLLPAH